MQEIHSKASTGDELKSSPCRECHYFKDGIERKVCREYDDCLLNAPKEPISAQVRTDCQHFKPKQEYEIRCCEVCGKPIEKRSNLTLKQYEKARFCGRECFGKSRKSKKVAKSSPIKAKTVKKEMPTMTKPKRKRREKINVRRIEFGHENADLMVDVERYATEDFRTFKQQVIFILSDYKKRRESDGQRKNRSA